METWLNGVLRETLVDTEPEEDIGVTVVVPEQVKGNEEDRIYPRLPSDDSESDSEMENIGATGGSSLADLMQELRLMKLQMQNMQDKEKSKDFTQTWENNVTPETHDPISKVRKRNRRNVMLPWSIYNAWRRREQREMLQRVLWGN